MTITEFLLARITEDERAAKRAGSFTPWGETFQNDNYGHLTIQPTRVLAECEAKRRIVSLATFSDSDRSAVDFWLEPDQRDLTPPGFTAAMIGVVTHLAAVYADHPDYDEAWRP